MTKLLLVKASPRGDNSVSRHLANHFVTEWQSSHPAGEVVERDLDKTDLAFTTGSWLQAYFTPTDAHTDDMKKELALSDQLVAEVLAADHIVIATPVYNYNVPAALKAYVDYIVRKGMTLGFDGKGMVHGKKGTILIASGGVYTEGSPIQDRDIAPQYLKLILNVIGITDVTIVAGGGAKAVDMGDDTMDGFVGKLIGDLRQAAST